ncbi:MAG: thymidylate kinase, partial [Bartonella sp.]|nr:thymidylate kinase [Bartonella sp.]
QAFLELAKHEPNRFQVIDGTCAVEIIADQIKDICHQLLSASL